MIYKYYVNCFKNGEPTYAAGYIEANSEEEAINKAIEPYDKNAYEFLELKSVKNNRLHTFIHNHPLFKEMYEAGAWDESDILFLIPNNQKRRLGLPLTHIQGRNKRQSKNRKQHYIYVNKSFPVIEQKVDNFMKSEQFQEAVNEFFDYFVDLKECAGEEEVKFYDIDTETTRRT